MSGFEVKREDTPGTITLRISGTLDGPAARQLQLRVTEADPRTSLVLDFTQVREFHDYAIGVLGHALRARKVQLLGLRTHHARMFEYFGISAGGGSSDRTHSGEPLRVTSSW
ncbi:MAG: STAS domain-containing protein [Myxococcaceae bacterium]|nr:STAS domain-containing protein [Myxococcaceae bacterium]